MEENKGMRFYEVIAKCGHVGRKNYALKSFAVKAENGRDAAKMTRDFPRVKHHHKDAIQNVIEIDEDRFYELVTKNGLDPYFHCTCVQEQKMYHDYDIYKEEKYLEEEAEEYLGKTVFIGKTLVRKPKRYIKNYSLDEGWAY